MSSNLTLATKKIESSLSTYELFDVIGRFEWRRRDGAEPGPSKKSADFYAWPNLSLTVKTERGDLNMAEENKIMINGKELKCLLCGSTSFEMREVLLNVAPLKFVGKNSVGKVYICKVCGLAHEFYTDL